MRSSSERAQASPGANHARWRPYVCIGATLVRLHPCMPAHAHKLRALQVNSAGAIASPPVAESPPPGKFSPTPPASAPPPVLAGAPAAGNSGAQSSFGLEPPATLGSGFVPVPHAGGGAPPAAPAPAAATGIAAAAACVTEDPESILAALGQIAQPLCGETGRVCDCGAECLCSTQWNE